MSKSLSEPYGAEFVVPFSSRSLALKSSWKSHQMTLFSFKKKYWMKKSPFEWNMSMFPLRWWCFHLKKLTTWERENESERKKEPQIPRRTFTLKHFLQPMSWFSIIRIHIIQVIFTIFRMFWLCLFDEMAIDYHKDCVVMKQTSSTNVVNLKYKRIPESGNTVIVKTLMQKITGHKQAASRKIFHFHGHFLWPLCQLSRFSKSHATLLVSLSTRIVSRNWSSLSCFG